VQSLYVDGVPLPFFCDMDGGWTLLYRVSRGVAGSAYELLTNPPVNDEVATEATPLGTTKHYASRLLGRWGGALTVEEARAVVYGDDDQVARTLTFDARNSTVMSWFTAQRLTAAPWTDVKSAVKFSIDPPTISPRTFLIHGPYNGCENDTGWLVVQGTAPTAPCAWEMPADKVRIFYASGGNTQSWNGPHGEGKSFAVFVR
jgi:hypothetical protein